MNKNLYAALMRPSSKIIKIGAVIGVICGLFLLIPVILPVSQAAPGDFPLPAPSPRPTLSDEVEKDSGGGGGSVIYGTVTDLSRQQPGAAVEVSVNGGIVRTDTDGSYSITGLSSGDYTVVLELNGQGTPAQGPVHVGIDGSNHAVVNLDYYSQAAPPTDTPQPTVTVQAVTAASTPAEIPDAGAPLQQRSAGFIVFGLLLLTAGIIGLYQSWGRLADRADEP